MVVVLLLGIGFLLYHASRSAMSPFILQLGPSFFFWLGVIYLILLLLCVPVYSYCYGAANRSTPFLIAGILPVPVPWFGALGAVVISLEGVFMWNTRWDKAFNYWHIGRPLFGAVLGMVAFFLFVCIVTASGNQPPFLKPGQPPGQQQNAGDFIIYYVVAFLVGYREQTFRELIKRATDLILQPGTPAPPAPDVTFRVDGRTKLEIPFPAPGENQKVSNVVEVMNSGTAPLQNPKVTLDPPEPAGWFALVKEKDLVSSGGSLAPGQTRTVEVSFTPKEKKPFSAELIVTADNLPNPKKIRLSGTVTS
ncbi:MAG: hypothetical protein JO112_13705 [Planctomycetes bacterium]|nr:hypothetical protein [Planctomycetota bacterium]